MINKFANLDILEYDSAQGALLTLRLRSGQRLQFSTSNKVQIHFFITEAPHHQTTTLRLRSGRRPFDSAQGGAPAH